MLILNPIKTIFEKYRRLPKLAKYRYTAYYEKLPVSDDTILIECFNGDGITGNPYWLLKAICSDSRLSDYRIYVALGYILYHALDKLIRINQYVL